MDTLYWTKVNSEIKFGYTAKQYFGKYTWKIVCWVPCARVILSDDDIDSMIVSRLHYELSNTYIGYHRHKRRLPAYANVSLLETLRFIKNKMRDSIKVRIEEPFLTFYTEDESTLKTIVKELGNHDLGFIKSLSYPKNQKTKELLESGAILTKTDLGYRYKVILREGRYTVSTKQQILNYLQNLDDQIKLNENGKRLLSESFEHLWNTFFYTNDTDLVTFLNLIQPGIVANIHKLVYHND